MLMRWPLMICTLVNSSSFKWLDASVNSASTNGDECKWKRDSKTCWSWFENVVEHCEIKYEQWKVKASVNSQGCWLLEKQRCKETTSCKQRSEEILMSKQAQEETRRRASNWARKTQSVKPAVKREVVSYQTSQSLQQWWWLEQLLLEQSWCTELNVQMIKACVNTRLLKAVKGC